MKIRSITHFCDPGWPLDKDSLSKAGAATAEVRQALEDRGYEVQTTRLATVPFPQLLGSRIEDAPELARQIEQTAQSCGFDYVSLGPALPGIPQSFSIIPDALAESEIVFFSGIMAEKGEVFSEAVKACAEIIVRAGRLSPDGFTNLRFTALANVLPGSPFFPAAYWDRPQTAFAIATEAADLAVTAFTDAESVTEGQEKLTRSIRNHAAAMTEAAGSVNQEFHGIDFSLAPFPEARASIGAALECIAAGPPGLHGSLAAAGILTEAIDRADFKRCGFSGLMLPVLEDSVLAQRAAEGTLSIKDLLLHAAVCGTGLDTVPLPGDVTAAQIAALLHDLCTLALRLAKPLTARLMPIPGKQAGDSTDYDFAYFSNSRVIALDAHNQYNVSLFAGGSYRLSTRGDRSDRPVSNSDQIFDE